MVNKKQQVRLVRCPKCAEVLQEPEHVPLYTCGGCDTILQAKNYKGHQRNTALSSLEQKVGRSNGVSYAPDGGESSGSSQISSSSGEHLEGQAPVSDLRNSEQNGTSISSGSTSVSKKSDILEIKEDGERGNRYDGNHSKSEQKGSANSVQHTALSEETSFIDIKENGEIDEQSDPKNQVDDYLTVLENVETEQLSLANSVKDDNGLDEQCDGVSVEIPYQHQLGIVIGETSEVEDSHVLENKELQQLTTEEESTEDEDDQHEQELKRCVHSANDASSLSESLAVEYPEEYLASKHNVPEETRKMHLLEEHSHQDQQKQKQVNNGYSAEDASSCAESPTHFDCENLAEHDSSDQQISGETRNFHLIEKLSHPDTSGKEVKYLDADEPEAAVSGKEQEKGPGSIEQAGYENSAIGDTTSSIESLEICEPVQSASDCQAEHDASDQKLSDEIREMQLQEECLYHTAEIEIHHHDSNEPDELETLGNEKFHHSDRTDLVEGIKDQLESVKRSCAGSSLTEATQVLNTDSVSGTEDGSEVCGRDHVTTPSSATDSKPSQEMGTTKISEDFHCEISRQKIENFGDNAACIASEVGSIPKENPRSLTKRSPGYDGSVSSCDGNDDKFPEQPEQVDEETLSTANAVSGYDNAEERREWNSARSERSISRNSGVPTQDRSSSSMPIDKKLKRCVIEEGSLEGNGNSQRNNAYRLDRDSFVPRVPYHRKSSEMTYETGSCSSYALHDEPSSYQMHHHPCRRTFAEAPFLREKEFLPMYYNSETSGEINDRPNYHDVIDRRRRAESWAQSGTLPRMQYSGELFGGRHSYMHRYPDDRRWSTQLPQPGVYYNSGAYMGPSWETWWDPYDSYLTSPPQYLGSDSSCAWGLDTLSLSDDLRHKDQVMRRLYLREKQQAVKKQFRPIAGGTPFITCNFCFNILQLPTNFLISRRSRREIHKLKCGACSKVLEFSLENEGTLAPCETIIDRNINLIGKSQANHSRQSSLNSANARELLSQNSLRASGRDKRELVHGSLSSRETSEILNDTEPTARGRPPRVTWKVPSRSKSPLHRLMGYPSLKDML
ncbi:unnamed protein product [Amaranthus hypochondriacus]